SVGSGLAAAVEALLVALDFVAAGDADAMVVIAAEDVGDAVKDLFTSAGWPVPVHGALAVVVGRALCSPALVRARVEASVTELEHAFATGATAPGWPALERAVAGAG